MPGRNIAIVGAGQAGLQLGITLLKSKLKHSVAIFTNMSPAELLKSQVTSSQAIFDSALKMERRLGLNFWDQPCPKNTSVTLTVADSKTATQAIYFQGMTDKPYQSVDQRLKFSRWMTEFEALGGRLCIQNVGLSELDKIAKWHELTVVAGGKGEISKSFSRNSVRSHFDKPQRALACLYVDGVTPVKGPQGVRTNIVPGIGEYFIIPGLTINGQCEMMLFEGIPGGPFDCWNSLIHPVQRLEKAVSLLKKYLPWEAERCQSIQLTEEQGTLTGCYTPIVRHPTFKLPCGKSVLGIGDTVVLNDPAAGQGANNAAKAADLYARRIEEHGQAPFDELWMQETFELYWKRYAKWATQWTSLLLAEPAPHVVELLKAASSSRAIANILANGFDDPSLLFPWIMNAADTLRIITAIKAQEGELSRDREATIDRVTSPTHEISSYGFHP